MQNTDKWFDDLYLENSPRMVKLATYLLDNRQIAEELVDEAFLILLSKRHELEPHPNLPGWLSQTLKNLIANELNSAKYRLEFPLEIFTDIPSGDTYDQSLSELLPTDLSHKELEILTLFYEDQLSHDQIARQLGISSLNCRTRLYRAKAHFKELINSNKIFL
ncbi:MAG: sigma-70 family RNA polymerase sigma factor [Bacteroidia bacterium]|nr:sigma-70 family RNA polymerase sigma factor [Bacteroidia bacterium]